MTARPESGFGGACTQLYSLSHRTADAFCSLDQELILLLILLLLCNLFKKACGSVVSNRIGMKFGRNVQRSDWWSLRFSIWCHSIKMAAMTSFH